MFSAYGLGFSDIAHNYGAILFDAVQAPLDAALGAMRLRAQRDMYAEGFDVAECKESVEISLVGADGTETHVEYGKLPKLKKGEHVAVTLCVTKLIQHAQFRSKGSATQHDAVISGQRGVRLPDLTESKLPLVHFKDNKPGAEGNGPAIIEEDFFTCRVPANWHYRFTDSMDLLLERV